MNDARDASAPDAEELGDVAVFPLPQLVLFPGAQLPLHFFEPRYRQMMDDIVAQDRDLLIVAQLAPGWRDDYEGQPPVQPVAGIGRIVARRKNTDGTYDVQLEGLARVSLEELPAGGKLYRRARASIVHDEHGGDVGSAELLSLLSLATQVVQCVREADADFQLIASDEDPQQDPSRFIDRIADQLVPDADARQQALETLDVRERLQLVRARVAHLHLALLASDRDDGGGGSGGGAGGRVLH
jgi:Lon protease-like protein